jgi:mannan endo-1,4-beta-mannosidase
MSAIARLTFLLALAASSVARAGDVADDPFVRVEGMGFVQDGRPYRFVGTNMWYAAYLGAPAEFGGDRERLGRELDLLAATGINNVRLLGASERSPLRNSLSPAISYRGKVENEYLLEGLDYALAEMAERHMKAVIFLNNFWEWSGGMVTYLSWVNGGKYVNLGDPAAPWPAFALFSAQFYSNADAVALYDRYVVTLLERRNTVNGRLYRADPTIMSWQLANEPRPGDGAVSRPNLPAYYAWIRHTAALIHEHAPRQLISLGSEGTMGCLELDECFLGAHDGTGIDYATFHMWPKNWRWFDAEHPDATYDSTAKRADAYISRHVALATKLGMPLVLEEFGFERDRGEVSPDSTADYRDRFFGLVFARVEASVRAGGPLAGTNFWCWGGYGRAEHADADWQEGDTDYTGDPPQERQGLNSVFSGDESTLRLLREHAQRLTHIDGDQR